MKVTYCLLKDLASLILPVLRMRVSCPTLSFLLLHTAPHKLDICQFVIWVKGYK
jgi:hypothetical protein